MAIWMAKADSNNIFAMVVWLGTASLSPKDYHFVQNMGKDR